MQKQASEDSVLQPVFWIIPASSRLETPNERDHDQRENRRDEDRAKAAQAVGKEEEHA